MKRLLVGSLMAMACSGSVTRAAEPSVLTVDSIEGEGYSVGPLRATIDAGAPGGPAAQIEIARATLPAPLGEIVRIVVHCGRVDVTARRVACLGGSLSATAMGADLEIPVNLSFRVPERRLEVEVPAIRYAGGQIEAAVRLDAAGLRLSMHGKAVELAALARDVEAFWGRAGGIAVDAGTADIDAQWQVTSDAGATGSIRAALRDLAFSDSTGRVAGEALSVDLAVDAGAGSGGGPWGTEWKVDVAGGGAYVEPVYVNFSEHPLQFGAAARIDTSAQRIELTRFRVDQPDVVAVSGSLVSIAGGGVESAAVEIERARLPAAYDTWLKGILVGTPFDRMQTAGEVTGQLAIEQGALSGISLAIHAVDLEDAGGRFALYGARGAIGWRRNEVEAAASSVTFDGGFLFGAGFDASTLWLRTGGTRAELLEPIRVPALGGALVIRRFSISDWGGEDLTFDFEGELEPIELRRLTVAVGWPPFAGTLSGKLPLLRYRGGVITVGGALEARAFDGDVRIEDLRIERPFGIVPAVAATIRLRDLDLGLLTEAFSFGSVIGRLDGDVENLKLLKNEPIAFDARFRTPAGDRSRHRISQRAVGTISKIAGGSGAVLSSTFLRVFKDFPYERLGISCRLENDICHMDGIEPADAGYYIVKGSGLPRLDLIGRVREVNWSRLIGQLKQALEEGKLNIE